MRSFSFAAACPPSGTGISAPAAPLPTLPVCHSTYAAAFGSAAADPDGLDEDYCFDARASGATVAVKLGDFGLATPTSSGVAALSPDEGDCRYLAPELLEPSPSSSSRKQRVDLAAADARPGTEVDNMIGRPDRVFVVLDHHDRIAQVAKLRERVEQAIVVARVQTD